MKFYLAALRKYATSSGRATRSEFWYFTLFGNILIPLTLLLIVFLGEFIAIAAGARDAVSLAQSAWEILFVIYVLSMLLPSLAVSVRRLHDVNFSGWWLLLSFVPIASLALFAFYVMDGTPVDNRFGLNPKTQAVP